MTLTISINPIQPSIFGSIFTPGVVVVVMVVVVVGVVMMGKVTMMIMMMAAATNVCTEENATLCQRMSGHKHHPLLIPTMFPTRNILKKL